MRGFGNVLKFFDKDVLVFKNIQNCVLLLESEHFFV
jgi:hypothetical protein